MRLPNTDALSVPEAAAKWSEKGWHPVPTNNKKPLQKWRDAERLSPLQTRTNFERYPSCNIAIKIPHGVVVLDIDHRPERGFQVALIHKALKNELKVPNGPIARTPSGGSHLWFSLPDGFTPKNWTSECGKFPIKGVDIRAFGSLATVPPSVRGEQSYWWMYWQPHLPMVSPKLLAALTPSPAPKVDVGEARPFHPLRVTRYVERAYESEIRAVCFCGKGGRNAQLFKSAAALGSIVAAGALPLQHVRKSLIDAATQCGLVRDDGMHAVQSTIQSGIQAGAKCPRKLPEAVR